MPYESSHGQKRNFFRSPSGGQKIELSHLTAGKLGRLLFFFSSKVIILGLNYFNGYLQVGWRKFLMRLSKVK